MKSAEPAEKAGAPASPAAAAAEPQPSSAAVETAAPVPAPLSPLAEALKALATAAKDVPLPRDPKARARIEETKSVAAFYEARNFEPVWRKGDFWAPAAASVLTRLQRANEDALDLGAFRFPALMDGSPKDVAEADFALSQAVVGYGRQASGGRVRPSSISGLITPKPQFADAAEILARVSAAGANGGDVLRGFNPPHRGYLALRAKLAELRDGPKPETPVAIAPGPVLRVGMSDQRVPLIRARFGLSPNEPADPLVYDTQVASRVAEFQRSKGIKANGILTRQTVNALAGQVSKAERLEAEIISNMERWRWLPRNLGGMHILVNLPEYMVRVFRDGRAIHETRAIVGQPKTPTPIFSNEMQYVIVNPYWNVPQSIIKEMGGAEKLSGKGYEVRETRYGVAVRQPPGPRNALGYIKLMFPNDHAVYLHDTPGRHLFSSVRRAFSHGCVRVQNPFKLAEVVMNGNEWSEQRLKSLIGRGERTIHLPQKLPIHLAYFTTFVDDNGQLQQVDDIYGHSRRLQVALGYK